MRTRRKMVRRSNGERKEDRNKMAKTARERFLKKKGGGGYNKKSTFSGPFQALMGFGQEEKKNPEILNEIGTFQCGSRFPRNL